MILDLHTALEAEEVEEDLQVLGDQTSQAVEDLLTRDLVAEDLTDLEAVDTLRTVKDLDILEIIEVALQVLEIERETTVTTSLVAARALIEVAPTLDHLARMVVTMIKRLDFTRSRPSLQVQQHTQLQLVMLATLQMSLR